MIHTHCKNNSLLFAPISQNLLVEEIGIDRRIYTPILRTIRYYNCHSFSGPIWRKQQISIDQIAYLLKVAIGIDMQSPQPIDIPIYSSIDYRPGCTLDEAALRTDLVSAASAVLLGARYILLLLSRCCCCLASTTQYGLLCFRIVLFRVLRCVCFIFFDPCMQCFCVCDITVPPHYSTTTTATRSALAPRLPRINPAWPGSPMWKMPDT